MGFKCCVTNCPSTSKKSHCFPNDFELFTQWCILIGRNDLMSRDFKSVRRTYRLCDDHFDKSYKFFHFRKRGNLKVEVVPSLNLPVQTDTSVSTSNICEKPSEELEEKILIPQPQPGPSTASDSRGASTSKPVVKLLKKESHFAASEKRKISEAIMSKKINTRVLIDQVRSNPQLWNLSHPKYSNPTEKELCWRRIASALGHPFEDIKRKWDSIRSTYRCYLRRNKSDRITKWYLADELDFLEKQVIKVRHCRMSRFNAQVVDTYEENKRLIGIVKQFPGLWDRKSPDFRDVEHRNKLWCTVAEHLRATAKDPNNSLSTTEKIKLRWKQLRSNYRRAVKYKIKARYEDDMAFIKPILTLRKRRSYGPENEMDSSSIVEISDSESNSDVDIKEEVVAKNLEDEMDSSSIVEISDSESNLDVDIKEEVTVKNEPICKVFDEPSWVHTNEDDVKIELDSDTEPNSSELKSSQDHASPEDKARADIIRQFFLSLAEAVKTLPPVVQAKVRAEAFKCVNAAEVDFLGAKVNCVCEKGETS